MSEKHWFKRCSNEGIRFLEHNGGETDIAWDPKLGALVSTNFDYVRDGERNPIGIRWVLEDNDEAKLAISEEDLNWLKGEEAPTVTRYLTENEVMAAQEEEQANEALRIEEERVDSIYELTYALAADGLPNSRDMFRILGGLLDEVIRKIEVSSHHLLEDEMKDRALDLVRRLDEINGKELDLRPAQDALHEG